MPALNWKVALGFGVFALIGFLAVAALFPALMIVMLLLLVLLGMAMLAPKFAATHAGIAIIFVLILLIALFGFIFAGVGQSASLSLVHAL